MADTQYPYLPCKNERCPQPIWLPHTSRLNKAPHLPAMPTDSYSEIFVCPLCVHVYGYRPLNVRFGQPPIEVQSRIAGLYEILLEFRCDKNNCGVRVLIHRPTMEHLDPAVVVTESESWILADVHCENEHRIDALPPKQHRYASEYYTDFP